MFYARRAEGVTGSRYPFAVGEPGKLMEEVRRRMRVKHYSLRTEQAYTGWIRRFILASGKRHPRDMGAAEVEAFLSRLASEDNVSAGTQNQALAAILFLYREVLGVGLPWLVGVTRAKRSQRLPAVLSREEVSRLFAVMEGRSLLLARLLYGSGLRLMEGLRLRVKDVDFARNEIVVRDGKGGKDRHTVLPRSLVDALHTEVERRGYCMRRTLRPVPARSGCRMRSLANFCTRIASSAGSTSFRQRTCRVIRAAVPCAASTSTTQCFHVR